MSDDNRVGEGDEQVAKAKAPDILREGGLLPCASLTACDRRGIRCYNCLLPTYVVTFGSHQNGACADLAQRIRSAYWRVNFQIHGLSIWKAESDHNTGGLSAGVATVKASGLFRSLATRPMVTRRSQPNPTYGPQPEPSSIQHHGCPQPFQEPSSLAEVNPEALNLFQADAKAGNG
jgi:hypothetical protein